MVFKELEIQGFKSFPDKVKIRFDAGVTGVVGPNGSGKSNLSDAVRWVLGETSSRQLRAAGKMEDVIFGGTRRRGAMGFAQVRLTLDNADHTFDLDADEVTIGRKYYRSGESEYTINGQVCRLRDVYELLLDTGIGRDGYSVIGQGRIAEIVAAKSSERREIFEEACGIAKYRYRKTEAERRLAAAGENLERLRDILGELESRVGPLEKESAKAEKFLELSARRKTLEVTLWTDGVHRARETVRQQVRDYETAQADYERFDRETRAAEQEAEEIRMQAQQLTVAVERLNGDIRSITQQISGSESRIAVLENDILRNEESAASLREEISAGEQDSTEAQAALQRHRAVAKTMEAEGEKLAAEIDALNAEIARLTDASSASGARKDTLKAELADLTARRTEAQVAQAAAEAAGETARQRLPALEANAEESTAQRDEAKRDLEDTIKYRRMLEENEKQLANVRSGLELKLKSRKAALDDADAAEQKLGRELDAARQRLSVLRELEKNMDGYQNSVKAVMRAAGARRLRGVIGPVSAILTVEPGCEVAVETALGGALQNIVVENEAAAKAAIALLRNDNAGRATFLPLDTVQPGVFRGRLSGTARLASSLVQADARYDNIVSNLLGRIIVVDDINEASRVARDNGYHNKVVTLDGQVINRGGSMTGGSMRKKENTFFGRKQEIRRLSREEEEGRKALETCSRALEEQGHICDTLAGKVMKEREEWQTLKVSLASLTARREGMEKTLEDQEKAAEEEMALKKKRDLELREGEERRTHISENLEKLAHIPEMEEDEESETLKKKLEEKNEEILSIHVSLTKARESLAFGKRMKEDREKALAEQQADRAKLDEEKKENEKLLQVLKEDMERLKEEFRKAESLWQDRQKNQSRMQDDSDRFAMEQKKLEESWRKTQEQSSKVKRDMAERQGRIDNFKAQEEEELRRLSENHMTRQEAEALRLPGSMADMRKEEESLSRKLSALGQVNPNGEEDYQKQLDKRTFYEEQIEDLTKARNGLETVIRDIDQTMTDQFSRAFKEINQEFGRIMQLMFQGGRARLELTDEAHPLEGGVEMYLQLPGKKRQPLSLMSGGERALTVIALLISFMAFRPAPFCFVDEIDAALDDANVERYSRMIADYKKKTQFIVISHRKKTMEFADTLQGVTMAEKGVSSLITVKMKDYVE